MRVKLNIGFLCGYVACLISGTPKCFQVRQLSGNLASLSASNIERFAPYLCTRNLTVFLVLQIKEEWKVGDLDTNSETQCLSYSQLQLVIGSNCIRPSIKGLYHFRQKYQPPSKHLVIICIKCYHILLIAT